MTACPVWPAWWSGSIGNLHKLGDCNTARPDSNFHLMTPDFSIVIPAYGEGAGIGPRLKRLREFLSGLGKSWELLVMVEKSPDDTLDQALTTAGDDPRLRVIDNQVHRGKGYAVKSGMLQATGRIIFFMDADLSTDLEAVPRFLETFEANPSLHVLIGSRNHAQSRIRRFQNRLRRVMGSAFNLLVRLLLVDGIRDTQCGFKAFRREAAHDIFSRLTLDGFAFDVEVLLLASQLGLPIRELPVVWENDEQSQVQLSRHISEMLGDVLRLFFRYSLKWVPTSRARLPRSAKEAEK